MRYLFYYLLVICVSVLSCNKKEDYSFIVAGHTYGAPGVNNKGLHPPFVAHFDHIRQLEAIRFGVFTGDIVIGSKEYNWQEVDEQIAQFQFPIYFAAGNHDQTDLEMFTQKYGPTYYAFQNENDGHIVLNPGLDHWNISGEQLIFLQNQLALFKSKRNIFIYCHEIIWYEPNKKHFNNLYVNSKHGWEGIPNFWKDIFPLLNAQAKPIYLFAGDSGAFKYSQPSYRKLNQVHFYDSGMGGIAYDHYLWVKVKKGKVDVQLMPLDTNAVIDFKRQKEAE